MTTPTLTTDDTARLLAYAVTYEIPVPGGHLVALRGNGGTWGICRSDRREFHWWTAAGWTANRDLPDADRAYRWPAEEAPTLALRLADELAAEAGEGE